VADTPKQLHPLSDACRSSSASHHFRDRVLVATNRIPLVKARDSRTSAQRVASGGITKAHVRHRPGVGQVCLQRRRTGSSQPVGTTPVSTRQHLDETSLLQQVELILGGLDLRGRIGQYDAVLSGT
jgi:hypothetical protein